MKIAEVNDDVYITMLAENITEVSDDNVIESNDPEINAATTVIADEVSNEVGDIKREEGQTDEEFQQMICRRVGEAYAKIKRSGKLTACFDKLDEIATRLGTNISLAFTTLGSDVMSDVSTLEADINEDTNLETYAKTELDKPTELRVTKCNWDMLFTKFGGEEEVGGVYKDVTGSEPVYDTNEAVEIADSHIAEIDSVPVDRETAEEIVDRVAYNDESTREDVEMLYKTITNAYALKSFIRNMFVNNLRNHKYGKAVKDFNFAVERYLPILYTFKKTTLNVPDKLFDKLHENMDKVLLAFNLGAYALLSLRKSLERTHSVLLDENVMNEDVADNEEISNAELAAYLHVYHTKPGRPLPSMGIDVRDVKLFGKKALQECELNHQEYKRDMMNNRRSTMTDVATRKLLAFTESLDDNFIPDGVTKADFVKGVTNTSLNKFTRTVFTTEDHNLQSSLFDFVLDVKYHSPVLKNIHHRFSELAHNAVANNENGSLSQEELNNIDNQVAIELSTDFLNQLLSRQ